MQTWRLRQGGTDIDPFCHRLVGGQSPVATKVASDTIPSRDKYYGGKQGRGQRGAGSVVFQEKWSGATSLMRQHHAEGPAR